jgi:hypothetical protein
MPSKHLDEKVIVKHIATSAKAGKYGKPLANRFRKMLTKDLAELAETQTTN